jgi:hypothetical protein
MDIKSLHNDQPHPDWGGWENFLNFCQVREETDGVIRYGISNCNYILFPDGSLLQNYGFHGKNVMDQCRQRGYQIVLEEIRHTIATIRKTIPPHSKKPLP